MSTTTERSLPLIDDLSDVIQQIATTERREETDVANEVHELAHRYRNVMRQDLMPLGQYTTQDRVSAITCMRHYMEEGELAAA